MGREIIGLGTFIWIGVVAWFLFGSDAGEIIVDDVISLISDYNGSLNVVGNITIVGDIPELSEDFEMVNPPEKDTWDGLGFE